MEEDFAHDLIAIDDCPSPALCRVHLVVAVPCELDARLVVSGALLAVNLATDVAELKFSETIRPEFEEALDFFIHKVLIPLVHPSDAPAACERTLWFAFLVHGSHHLGIQTIRWNVWDQSFFKGDLLDLP